MLFIDNENNYPRFIGDLTLAHPKWVKEDELPSGWLLVEDTEPPLAEEHQKLIEHFPVELNGQLVRNFELVNRTQEELDKAAKEKHELLLSRGFMFDKKLKKYVHPEWDAYKAEKLDQELNAKSEEQ